ncbi:ribokinase [Acidipropionibacterium acidipropionici]|uniref:Deoxyribokinase n=1 Tax=Acidipropionibacterium acidipropionici TaxID=1748 RepID=A0AAC8YEW1_9ACTN|nr:ribokinase [Acidipropionibacterium acidipropionici]AMS05416.1 ribokinase [Acidipropionibacterium acidipropionici]AOZ46890.1 ribokinase [Acidipropionibacterium acidipropionici]AZP37028.1 ribokinase [Acidipropionibacterium acidipropionici]
MPDPTRKGLCIVGSFMMDLIAYADRQPQPGETLVGYDFVQAPGGKGFNQALAGARAGAQTSMIGRLGTDPFGDEFVDRLRAEGIDCRGVIRDAQVGTGVGHPTVARNGQNAIVIVPRSNSAMTVEDIAVHRDVIAAAAVLLLQLELPMPAVMEAARIAHDAGTTVILNPAPFSPLSEQVLEPCDIVIPNEVELSQWAGQPLDTVEAIRETADALAVQHNLTIIATLGERGSLIVSPGRPVEDIAPFPVTAVDTVGAGDAFCGYLAALLSEGSDLVDAVQTASAAAAISVTRKGGSTAPTFAETVEFLATAGNPSPSTPITTRTAS